MIRILHLSDFHLNTRNLRDWKNYVKQPFLENIKELNKKHKIELVAFTGDMVDKGGKDYKDAT